jgi:hypothetical protein
MASKPPRNRMILDNIKAQASNRMILDNIKAQGKPTPKSPPKSTPNEKILEKMRENAPKTPSSTAKVPKGGAVLPKTGNLAGSLIKRGVGKLVPGLGLILTAVEVANYLRGDETAANEPVKSRGQMGRPPKEKESESSQKRAERVKRDEPFDITELKMRQDLENPRDVLPARGSDLKDKGPARSELSSPSESSINRRHPIQEAACRTYYGGIG